MKTAIALFALALGASIPLQGANASDEDRTASLINVSQDQDISAAKKRKRHQVYVYPRADYGYYRPAYGYYDAYAYPRAFAPGDPSWQSPELRRLRALNRCVFDLGYGRWENCN